MRCVAKLKLWDSHRSCSVLCKQCVITTAARKWLCTCGEQWAQCSVHRAAGFQCGSGKGTTDGRSSNEHKPAVVNRVIKTISKPQCRGGEGTRQREDRRNESWIQGYMLLERPDGGLLDTVRGKFKRKLSLNDSQ